MLNKMMPNSILELKVKITEFTKYDFDLIKK